MKAVPNLTDFSQTSPYPERIMDDPPFVPSVHLALGQPDELLSLADFGYDSSVLESAIVQTAATSCFQVLTAEGVETLYHVCKQLEPFATSNPRIERNVRGGVYRSDFLRDLALSVDVAQHVSELMGAPLAPHGMPHQLAHLNFQPIKSVGNVDKWHYDTLELDYVMFVTDPDSVTGGEFQYYLGTREELAEMKQSGSELDPTRIVAPKMPGPGYAVMMQGNYVVHQARGIAPGEERITMVNGYTYTQVGQQDYTALGQLVHADPEPVVMAEYARHMALRCVRQLSNCVNQPQFDGDNFTQIPALEAAQAELELAIKQLVDFKQENMRHFGD